MTDLIEITPSGVRIAGKFDSENYHLRLDSGSKQIQIISGRTIDSTPHHGRRFFVYYLGDIRSAVDRYSTTSDVTPYSGSNSTDTVGV